MTHRILASFAIFVLLSQVGCAQALFGPSAETRNAEALAEDIQKAGGRCGEAFKPDETNADWWYPGAIISVDLRHLDLSKVDLSLLLPHDTVQYLALEGSVLGEQQLEPLSKCQRLRDLNLTGTDIDDKSMKVVPKLESLEQLNISETEVTDKGVKLLNNRNLLSVIAICTPVTSSGVAALKTANSKSIDCLLQPSPSASFRQAQRNLTRQGASTLLNSSHNYFSMILGEDWMPDPTSVGYLELLVNSELDSHIHVEDQKAMSFLGKLDRISFLYVEKECVLTSTSFEELANVQIDTMRVSCDLSPDCLRSLNSIPKLNKLMLEDQKFTDLTWQAVTELEHPAEFEIIICNFKQVKKLVPAKGIRPMALLTLNNCRNLQDPWVEELKTERPDLMITVR